jgi:hypothetical protein
MRSPRKRKRRQRSQRLDRSAGAVGRKRPRSDRLTAPETGRDASTPGHHGSACPATIRRSVRECRETLGSPVNRTEPKTPWESPRCRSKDRNDRKIARRGASWELTRYGYTSIVQVAEVGRTHRASCSPEGRKAPRTNRALARRKLEASPDARLEWREGETVRGQSLTLKPVSAGSVCGSRLAYSRYDGRRSRAFARLVLTGKATRGPRLEGESTWLASTRKGKTGHGQRIGRHRG